MEQMFVKDGCNLIANKKLDCEWREIKLEDVFDFLTSRGLSWHKEYNEDTHLFVWAKDEDVNGKEFMNLSLECYDSIPCDLLIGGFIVPLYDIDVEKMLKWTQNIYEN